MKLEDVLDKEQLEKVKVVGEKLEKLKFSMNCAMPGNAEMEKMLIRIAEEDAESIMTSIVDGAFFDYMNKIKD